MCAEVQNFENFSLFQCNIEEKIGVHNIFVKPEWRWKPIIFSMRGNSTFLPYEKSYSLCFSSGRQDKSTKIRSEDGAILQDLDE